MRSKQREACIGLASVVLVVLAVTLIYTTGPSQELHRGFLDAVQQSLLGASLGIIGVFTLNAELPKQYQVVKIAVAGLIVLFILTSFVRLIITLSLIFEVYGSLYFFALSYLWGTNKIEQGSYERLLEYKTMALYPSILYCFVFNQIFAVILHTF